MASEHDPKVAEKIVHILKTQGLFDQWRKDCLSFVDSRPAYEHLRDKVNTSVATFLSQQKWSPGLNKNQLREKLRNHILLENFFESGVTKIIDQIVTPKVYPTIKPQVEEIVYTVLGVKTSPQAEDSSKQKLVSQNNCDILCSVSNLTADSVKSPLKESSVDSPTSTVFEQLNTNIAVQDFSESAHLPERQQSPPMNKQFDNFCNLREKLQQSDPLKTPDLLQQELKKTNQQDSSTQDPKKCDQDPRTSGELKATSEAQAEPSSIFEEEINMNVVLQGSKIESVNNDLESSSSEKKSHSQKEKIDTSINITKSKGHSNRSKDHRSHSKHSKSAHDKSDLQRSKEGSKESRSGRSNSKGSSHRDKSHSHHRRSSSGSRSHHRDHHHKSRHHHHKGSHHSHKRTGRDICREETTKKMQTSYDKEEGSGSVGGDCGGTAGGSNIAGSAVTNTNQLSDQGCMEQCASVSGEHSPPGIDENKIVLEDLSSHGNKEELPMNDVKDVKSSSQSSTVCGAVSPLQINEPVCTQKPHQDQSDLLAIRTKETDNVHQTEELGFSKEEISDALNRCQRFEQTHKKLSADGFEKLKSDQMSDDAADQSGDLSSPSTQRIGNEGRKSNRARHSSLKTQKSV